jgi:hypothetical protein
VPQTDRIVVNQGESSGKGSPTKSCSLNTTRQGQFYQQHKQTRSPNFNSNIKT